MPSVNLAREVGVPVQSLPPAARNANTTVNGTSIDLAGYESAMVVLAVGTITDGTHVPKLQDSDDNSSFADVAAGGLQGSFANLATNVPQRIGYLGTKRFIRAVVTTSGATTGGVFGANLFRGTPHQGPAA